MPRRISRIGITPNRLFAAADVLMNAVNSASGMETRVDMHVGSHRQGGMRPREAFACEEYMEAMAMLMRMGLLPHQDESGGGRDVSGGAPRNGMGSW
jgi:hypothetical protein